MSNAKLSPTMRACLALARANGGRLAKYPGGFWAAPGGFKTSAAHCTPWFGTQTVRALVERGALAWGEYLGFPTEARIAETGIEYLARKIVETGIDNNQAPV